MAILGYHDGRSRTDTTRRNAKFWVVSNGRLKGLPQSQAGNRMYGGREWEVAGFATHRKALAASDFVDSVLGEYAVCMHDGSLGHDECGRDTGFEIVFDPMTPKAFAMIRPLVEQVSAKLAEMGGQAHDGGRCGYHIHTSRVAWGNDDDARDLAYGKVMMLTERFQAEFSAIARRDLAYTGWCKPTGFNHANGDGSRALRRKAKHVQHMQGIGVHDDNRYRVWNFQNKSTIECRAFNGTLKVSTMYATDAFVFGLVRWCMQHTTPEAHTLTFDELIAWIGDADLTAYWAVRKARVNEYTAWDHSQDSDYWQTSYNTQSRAA